MKKMNTKEMIEYGKKESKNKLHTNAERMVIAMGERLERLEKLAGYARHGDLCNATHCSGPCDCGLYELENENER